jgi:hypothetical protein
MEIENDPYIDPNSWQSRNQQINRNLAAYAASRQNFTNHQYKAMQEDMARAKREAEKQKEMARRTGFGGVGMGLMASKSLGLTGPQGMIGGLALGMLGEMGTRMGEGQSFGTALKKSLFRLPTANEVMGIGQGALMHGIMGNMAAANQPGAAAGMGVGGAAATGSGSAGSLGVPLPSGPAVTVDNPFGLMDYDDNPVFGPAYRA